MRTIYLDYNATTPIAPCVREAMLPYLRDNFGNPSSSHAVGREARQALADARQGVARLLGSRSDEILFTSGGTESNNLAILGSLRATDSPPGGHLVISAVEHPAVVEPARHLERMGVSLTIVAATSDGLVDPQAVEEAIRPDTRLVSIMHANNEIGTVQPIAEIARRCRRRSVLVHTDAAQSAGKISVLVDDLGVDLLTLAGHKLYAPKGIGALYVRNGTKLARVLFGAGQEKGLSPGTENIPYCVALGRAAELAAESLEDTGEQMKSRRDRLSRILRDAIGAESSVNGIGAPRLPNTLSINFPGVRGSELLSQTPGVCASTGAACHSTDEATETVRMSDTLRAIGLPPEVARGTVRLSTGRATTDEEVDQAAAALISTWNELR